MAIERGDIIGVILGKIRATRYGSVQSPDWAQNESILIGILSVGFDNRDRMGIGAVSEIFFSKKETFKENEWNSAWSFSHTCYDGSVYYYAIRTW